MVFDLVGFYRDVDGNLAQGEFFRDYVEWRTGRHIRGMASGYVNQDKGNIKGMDLTLKKRFSNNYSFNVIYTLQFSRSTGSSYLNSTGDELRPNDGDRAHKFTTYLNYVVPKTPRAMTCSTGSSPTSAPILSSRSRADPPPASSAAAAGAGITTWTCA